MSESGFAGFGELAGWVGLLGYGAIFIFKVLNRAHFSIL